MAGINFVTQQAAIAWTGSSVVTVMEVVAATNTRVRINRIEVTVYGAAAGTANSKVEVCRKDGTSTGTSTPGTVTKRNETDSETLQTTSTHSFTVEPTVLTPIDVSYCNSVQGSTTFLYSESNPMYVKGGSFLAVRVTCGATANCTIRIEGEE